jgi:Contact-dependent growth inhibition CdiA C-terminal domain
MHATRFEYELYAMVGYIKVIFQEETGGYLVIHPEHGQNEWEDNKHIGRMLAELGEAIVLLPNILEKISPDAWRNGEEWEFKTIKAFNLKNAVQNALRKGKTQSPNILCFINMLYTIENITLGIYNAVKFDKTSRIEKIAILFQDGRLIEMTREEVRKGMFVKKFY